MEFRFLSFLVSPEKEYESLQHFSFFVFLYHDFIFPTVLFFFLWALQIKFRSLPFLGVHFSYWTTISLSTIQCLAYQVWVCLSYFSHFCEKILDKKQLEGCRVCFSSQFEVAFYQRGETWQQDFEAASHIEFIVRKQKTGTPPLRWLLIFYSV